MSRVQLEGVIIFNSTTHSTDVTSLILNLSRPTTTVPGTFGDANATAVLGSEEGSMNITFNHDEGDTSGIWTTLRAVQMTDAGSCSFSARYKSGSQSATNPTYSGTVLISDLDIGGAVGELRSQTKTWTVYGVTQATATS